MPLARARRLDLPRPCTPAPEPLDVAGRGILPNSAPGPLSEGDAGFFTSEFLGSRILTMLPTLLQADPAGSPFGMQIVLFAIIFGIFYFIVFRPMRKRQRETEAMLQSLERGAGW